VGPALLIGLGILLLLQNLGTLPLGFWATLSRLWPALLILLGLDILLGRRSALGGLIMFGLVAALIGGTLLWALRLATPLPALEAMAVRQPLGEVERAEVLLDFSAGDLSVAASNGTRYLVNGTAVGAREDYSVQDGTARLELSHDAPTYFFAPFANDLRGLRWDLDLAQELPLDLSIIAGAGQARIDLTGLQVERFDLESSVAAVNVTFPAEGRIDASIEAGLGQVTVTIPPGLPARITASTAIADLSMPATYVRRGDVYETPGFSTEDNYLDLTLSMGIGGVVVK
jgi:hypothetical protein